MKTRYRLYRHNGTVYLWDNETGKRESLRTTSRKDADVLLPTKNEAHQQPALSLRCSVLNLLAARAVIGKIQGNIPRCYG